MTSEEEIRAAIADGGGCIIWWPGGQSHNTICAMLERGEVVLTDISGEQETKYEVRLAPGDPS